MYELCESSGLTLRSSIYSGIAYPDPRNLGQTGPIVKKLLDHYLGKGYTEVRLTKELTLHNTYICGTLRQDCKGNPKEVIKKNKLKRCEVIWRRNASVVMCKWRGRRDILMISNKHNVEMAEVMNKHGQSREKPNIVRDCNEGMSGIDRSDQITKGFESLSDGTRN